MPHKDPETNRAYKREWATKRRQARLAAKQAAHPLGPLGWEGERLIAKWIRRGEYLLRTMIGQHRYWEEHKEKRTVYNARYYGENKQSIRMVQQQWEEKNRQKSNGYKKKWAAQHPESAVTISARRRARKLNAPLNDLTAAQWLEMKAAYNFRCVYCPPYCKACVKKTHKLTQDHITPLSKHGPNTVTNVVPACLRCNRKKFIGPPLLPIQPLLLTIAPSRRQKTG